MTEFDNSAPMNRLPDWQPRLVAYLSSVSGRQFMVGHHDCALFTAGAVFAMTGNDYAKGWRSKYHTLRGGQKALKKAGHTDHVALVASILEEVAPAFAHKGDVAVVDGDDGGQALGIVQGEGVYVLRSDGMAVVSRLTIRRAFRV